MGGNLSYRGGGGGGEGGVGGGAKMVILRVFKGFGRFGSFWVILVTFGSNSIHNLTSSCQVM